MTRAPTPPANLPRHRRTTQHRPSQPVKRREPRETPVPVPGLRPHRSVTPRSESPHGTDRYRSRDPATGPAAAPQRRTQSSQQPRSPAHTKVADDQLTEDLGTPKTSGSLRSRLHRCQSKPPPPRLSDQDSPGSRPDHREHRGIPSPASAALALTGPPHPAPYGPAAPPPPRPHPPRRPPTRPQPNRPASSRWGTPTDEPSACTSEPVANAYSRHPRPQPRTHGWNRRRGGDRNFPWEYWY